MSEWQHLSLDLAQLFGTIRYWSELNLKKCWLVFIIYNGTSQTHYEQSCAKWAQLHEISLFGGFITKLSKRLLIRNLLCASGSTFEWNRVNLRLYTEIRWNLWYLQHSQMKAGEILPILIQSHFWNDSTIELFKLVQCKMEGLWIHVERSIQVYLHEFCDAKWLCFPQF